ncbi:WXG100 family type VII secretion target [Saccharopolyspora shandongensis]|uniref:WXG100 family type VII secretion target n=1 Tax=Saccharopolyspora shandongensis TaxID=418495 RepID=UPI00340A23AF
MLGAGLEVLSAVLDPIGTGVSWLVGWLIEFVQPLTDMLDWLAGNADAVAAHAQTWRNVGESLRSTADALQADVSRDTAGWTGAAADAYRSQLAATAELIRAQSQAAGALAEGTETAGMLVGTVREVVRDLIADCVGRLVSWAIEAATGVGVAAVAVQASARVARWAVRIMEVVQKLLRALGDLVPLLRKLVDLLGRLRKILTDIAHGKSAPQPPEKPPNTPNDPNTPRNPNDPPNNPPDDPKTGHPDPDDPDRRGGHDHLPRTPDDPNTPHPEMTPAEKQAHSKYLDELQQRYSGDFDDWRTNDPAHVGKSSPGTINESRIALDMRESGRLPDSLTRPKNPDHGDFIDSKTGERWDIKSFYSDYPEHIPQDHRKGPFKHAITPERFEDSLTKEFAGGNKVIVDTRNVNSDALGFMTEIVQKNGWEDRVLWYP